MKETALITGASSGIGYELAELFALDDINLVLVARRKNILEKLSKSLTSRYDVKVKIIQADLSDPTAVSGIYDELKKEKVEIDYLVNNAGFGEIGPYKDLKWQTELGMMQVNMVALAQLTKLFIKDMVSRKSGRIMNVASTAAFQPGPGMAVYYATKAFVYFYSDAIAYELRKSGVTVTTFCPGPTESDFAKVAKIKKTSLMGKIRKAPTREVAEYGYKAMMRGRSLAIPGVLNKKIRCLSRLAPRKLVSKVVQSIHTG